MFVHKIKGVDDHSHATVIEARLCYDLIMSVPAEPIRSPWETIKDAFIR
jgi:hypothetical protein